MTMGRNVATKATQFILDPAEGSPQTPQEGFRGAQFSVQPIKSDKHGNQIMHWRLLLDDARGGLNVDTRDLETGYSKFSDSSLDTQFYRHLTLPLLTTNQTTPDPTTGDFCSSANIFDRLVIGVGSTANASLFVETSATDPTIVARTYSPASVINALWPVLIANSDTLQLAVCREGGVVEILSDIGSTPTSAGTMHSDTTKCYGIVQTPTPEKNLLIYASGKLYIHRGTDAISREPDVVQQSVPNYGYALGVCSLGGATRAYWVWPESHSLAAHMLTKGSESAGKVVHTDLYGGNPQRLDMNLPFVRHAVILRNTIVASDGSRITWHTGSRVVELKRLGERKLESDTELVVAGLYVRKSELLAEVEARGDNSTIRWVESYNFDTGTWHVVSGKTTLSSTGAFALPSATGSLPVSATTSYMHVYSDGAWRRKLIPPYDTNSFSLRYTNASTFAESFESTGTYTSPYWELPGLEGWPKQISRIIFLGDVDSGGDNTTSATVQVEAGGVDCTFTTGHERRSQVVDFEDNGELFYQLQVEITATRNSGQTTNNVNAFPIIIEGYAYVKALPQPFQFIDDPNR